MQKLQLFKVLKISIHLYCGSHDGRKEKSPFSHIIEHSPTSFALNSVFIGPNDFKFGTETRFMVL